ncbi:V-type ATP synthase subunit A [Candidatus Nanohalobium constans]|uniref:A-type ATP synthase subunit A n=1 Tax=Candidatus Nanohalobium constans TaxID=2565781 RepID=A0A5Q0UIE7_9ARCH|nr:V-type ATP synthase subunit A [Candidatus Nanohalobium constans]QGA80715.1 V/A-type H+/Na+-transporting ATPase subunit A [Candidatus Nanohalobium constans]
MTNNESQGEIYKVTGPVVIATDMNPQMYDVVSVGKEELMGEVIQIEGEKSYIQVYEDTTGVKPGEPVKNTEQPLSVELGPGLLGSIYDGLQRPLPQLEEQSGSFIARGEEAPGIDLDEEHDFKPTVEEGDEVSQGDVIGKVEVDYGTHKVLVPPNVEEGEVAEVNSGNHTVTETVVTLENGEEIQMRQEWPIREARPAAEEKRPEVPLITGQRVLDGMFPIAKGGTAAIPGPFGSGKTVTQQSLAKFSDADIIVYIGCGERGNEMTEVLEEFPELEDPQTGDKIINRTVLIANTSNMPVAAREASIYTGVTIAEYFRDMGLDVALMADSTSRWAEAMREVSARLEEMPGERGYPAYLASRLAEFYERAGRVEPLSNQDPGSVSIVGAVSPPGGDFSEPVTQNTLRVVKNFWALDSDLAEKRHFPSINWDDSYSGYSDKLAEYFQEEVEDDWPQKIQRARDLLQKDGDLQETVQLVGKDALPDRERLTLEIATMVKEFFLQQNAFHPVDQYSSPEKTYHILDLILEWGDSAYEALEDGAVVQDIVTLSSKNRISEMQTSEEYLELKQELQKQMQDEFEEVVEE